jgi:aryl-alcohol dehydrogenase-like predicted oxidoreductase
MSADLAMQQRPLGTSGLMVSAVGLGGNIFGGRLDLTATRAVVHKALDLGVTLIDTADVYGNKGGSESYLGEVLGPRRKDIVLATKFGLPMDAAGKLKGASRAYIMQAGRAARPRGVRDLPRRIQLARAQHRAGVDPDHAGAKPRAPAVLSARRRPSYRQVSARRGGPKWRAACL